MTIIKEINNKMVIRNISDEKIIQCNIINLFVFCNLDNLHFISFFTNNLDKVYEICDGILK
jgi:hypothetical protein